MAMLGLRYDLRGPGFDRAQRGALYRTALEQAAWADQRGFARITLSEHHAAEDGYCPSPIVMASAMAGCTARVELYLALVILPLHDPLHLAEDLAVLDLASGGRLRPVFGAGYRAEEFELFGARLADRPAAMERGIEILRRAWTGEPFELDGRTVRVTPTPLQDPHPPLIMGGASKAAARRAARIADGFDPTEGPGPLFDEYLDACAELGRTPGPAPPRLGPSFVHVSEDPDRDWARIGPHALYETNTYAAWLAGRDGRPTYASAADAHELRASGRYQVVTPEECAQLINETDLFYFHPLMAGLDPELSWQSLELVASRVLPLLRPPVVGTT